MACHVLGGQRRAVVGCSGGVDLEAVLDRVSAEASAVACREDRVVGLTASFMQPFGDCCDGRGGEFFASFAAASDMGAGGEVNVGVVDAGQFGDPESGLNREREQGTIAPSGPRGRVRRGEQRVGLGGGEERDECPVVAFSGRWRALVGSSRRVLGGAARRIGTANGSLRGERCGSGCCCAGRVRDDRGTRSRHRRPSR